MARRGKGHGRSGGGIRHRPLFRQFGDRRRTPRAHVRQILQAGLHRPRSELRYLRGLHRNLAGETLLGELVCNEAISGDLLEIFRALYDAAYPIERMVLIDEYDAQDGPSIRANNSSAFNFRFIAGTGVLSNHSRGMAVDINPLYTPYVKTNGGRTVVAPAEAAPYAERKRDFPYKIAEDAPCCREFLRHGFTWGGHWKSLKDYQHFEKSNSRPEASALRREAARGYFGTATIDSESLPGIPGQHPASSGQHKGSRPFEVGSLFPSGIPGFSGDRIILRRRVFPSAKNCRTRP